MLAHLGQAKAKKPIKTKVLSVAVAQMGQTFQARKQLQR